VVVRHTAECGNWEELERVCRCKRDVRYTAECENWEELKDYADSMRISDTPLSLETCRN
jgi:hypothetical protein